MSDLWMSCVHPGGFRTEDGHWECSRCGYVFDDYDAWADFSDENRASANAVRAAIAADLALMETL